MSDKPIENLAVGWLPGVNVPAHPPDAVSGAATPAQQFERFRCLSCGFTGNITMEEIATHRSRCAYGTTEGIRAATPAQIEKHIFQKWGGVMKRLAEPAATPEAQIPEKWQRLYREACLLNARFPGTENPVQFVIEELAAAESQLAALRVERDRAWNEARQLAQGVVNEYSECFFDENRPNLQYCYTHNTKHCTQKQTNELATQILARPIPAEPGERKEVPNGVD